MSDAEDGREGKQKKEKPRSFVKVPDVFIGSSQETVGPKASRKQSLEGDAAAATEEVVRETGKLLAQAKSIQKKAAKWEQKRQAIEADEEEQQEAVEEESLPLVPNTFLPSSVATLPASKAKTSPASAENKPKPAPKFPVTAPRGGAPATKPKAKTKAKFPSMAPRGGTPVTKGNARPKASDVKGSIPTTATTTTTTSSTGVKKSTRPAGTGTTTASSAPTTLKSALKNSGSAAEAPPASRISLDSASSGSSDDSDYYTGNLKVKLLQELETITWAKSDDTFATFYEADGKATQTLTYKEIWDQSGVVSYHLRVTWKLQKGQTVALVLDYGLTYITTWLGCLRAGVVPIVVASPIPPNFEQALTKLNVIMHAVAPVALILTDSIVKFWKKEDENDRKSPTRKMWPEQAPWKAVDKLPKSKAAEAGGAPRESILGRFRQSIKGSLHSLSSNHKRGSDGSRKSILQTMLGSFGGNDDDDGDELGGPPSPRVSFFGGSQHSATGAVSPLPRQSIRASIFGQDEKEPLLAGTAFDEKSLQSSDVCCYQATSGSTAEPKICMVTFQALYDSLNRTRKAIPAIFSSQNSLSGLTWVPPDHHLGLFLAMLCPLVSGCSMHYMSSVNYEGFPLQWLKLLSTYKIGWTVAPDNGYRWVIREFTKTLNSSTTIMTSLNLSHVKVLLNIGETPRFGTPGKIRKCFVPYWLPKDCSIMTGYGLAEHVLPISWIEQNVISVPTCNNFALTKRVAVADREKLEDDEIAVIVVDPSTNRPVSKGQVGEIWIWSPCLAHLPGYFKNKQLTKKNYQAKLKGSKMEYLRTGDVGLFKDNHLYVCCRKEDVLANSQGIKFCPPDIEWFAEDCQPEIRAGRVAAFASVAGTVEIALEVYESTTAHQTKQICRILSEKIPKFTRMEVSSVVALPQGKLAITPISTVKRRHAKRNLLKEELPILFDFPERKKRISLDKTADVAPIMDSFTYHDDDEDTPLVSLKDSPSKDQSPVDTPVESQKGSKESTEETGSAPEKNDQNEGADSEEPKESTPAESVKKDEEIPANKSASVPDEKATKMAEAVQPKKSPFKSLADKFGGSAPTKRTALGLPSKPVTVEKSESSSSKPRDAAKDTQKKSQKEAPPLPAGKGKFAWPPLKKVTPPADVKTIEAPAKDEDTHPIIVRNEVTKPSESSETPSNVPAPTDASPVKSMEEDIVNPTANKKSSYQKPVSAVTTNKLGVATTESLSDAGKPSKVDQKEAALADKGKMVWPPLKKAIPAADAKAIGVPSKDDDKFGGIDVKVDDEVQGSKLDSSATPSNAVTTPAAGVDVALPDKAIKGEAVLGSNEDALRSAANGATATLENATSEIGVADTSPSLLSDATSDPDRDDDTAQAQGAESAIEEDKSATAGAASEVDDDLQESMVAHSDALADVPAEQQENTADSSPDASYYNEGVARVMEQKASPESSASETPITPRVSFADKDASLVGATAATSEDTDIVLPSTGTEGIDDTAEPGDRDVLDIRPLEPDSDESLGDDPKALSRPGLGLAITGLQGDESDPQEDALVMNFGPAVEEKASSLDEKEIDQILIRYLGPSFDNELSWEESGLSSTASVAMRRDLESAFLTTLPPDFLDLYQTPGDLKKHVRDIVGGPLDEHKPPLKTQESYQLSWCTTGLLQALLMVVMFVLFSAPLVPCWLVFELLQAHNMLYMLLVPIYLGSYSVIVIVVKWLVICRYKPCQIRTPSVAYLRWWFVDRMVHTWECWVGRFIVDTPLLWLFYTFMGARISPSCQLAGFIREMDLVSIGPNSSLKYPCLKCRKFTEWDESSTGPIMTFRSIAIGKFCTVRGMLSPGVRMDDGSMVERLCVVPEGAIIQGGSLVAGNPAYVADEAEGRTYPCWMVCGLMKLIWLVLELAFIYGIWEGALYLNPPPETAAKDAPFDFAYWALFAATCLMISLLSSIVLKLLLIGSRRPGKQNESWCYYPFEWAADYHFNLITLPFRLFARNSRLSNVVLMLHGMSIDFGSKIEMESFPPSKMDLISIKRSMLGTVTLDVKNDGVYYRTNIEDSSVGQFSHIDEDTLLIKALIPPLTRVDESVVHHKLDPERAMDTSFLLYLEEAFSFLLDVLMFVKVSMTGFVAYLVWNLLMEYVSISTCVPICAASLAAQGLVWNCIFILVERLRFCRVSGENVKPWIPGLHWVYRTTTGTFQEWSFLKITYGSPIFGILARIMGVTFEGRALYFGERIFDFPLATLGDRTVLDGAMVCGHNICYDRITYGRSCTAGLVHDQSIIMANRSMATKKETGPWECIVETPPAQTVMRRSTTIMAMLPRGALDIEDFSFSDATL